MKVTCPICPKACVLDEGVWGNCRARCNRDGRIVAPGYGHPSAIQVDPMEKKPLYHFYPGESILSIGTAGCNLHCKNCQNASLSQARADAVSTYTLLPHEVPALAHEQGCRHVAYTYAEPLVCYEYTKACCETARAAGLSNVLVTAGYIEEEPLRDMLPFVDAANVDIKAFDDACYRANCQATLAPVLRTLRMMHDKQVHVEITYLVIPTLNDDLAQIRALCAWVMRYLGPEVPIHFSRFFPQYQLRDLPVTPLGTLHRARDCAQQEGLHFVYLGNVETPQGAETRCPHCRHVLIRRHGYAVALDPAFDAGRCTVCGTRLYGRWRSCEGVCRQNK